MSTFNPAYAEAGVTVPNIVALCSTLGYMRVAIQVAYPRCVTNVWPMCDKHERDECPSTSITNDFQTAKATNQ